MPLPARTDASSPAVRRLATLAVLNKTAEAALEAAILRPRVYGPRRELLGEGHEIREVVLIVSGWAARVRVLEDGRRQIINFLLPGDLIGLCGQDRPVASSTIMAITVVESCVAPDARRFPPLAQAYEHSRALEEAHLLLQITRLGRLNAHERIADLFMELLERLERSGLADAGRFAMPLTQEVIADAVGLTPVHVNRTLQALRQEGLVEWKGRDVLLVSPAALRRVTGRPTVRVMAEPVHALR